MWCCVYGCNNGCTSGLRYLLWMDGLWMDALMDVLTMDGCIYYGGMYCNTMDGCTNGCTMDECMEYISTNVCMFGCMDVSYHGCTVLYLYLYLSRRC